MSANAVAKIKEAASRIKLNAVEDDEEPKRLSDEVADNFRYHAKALLSATQLQSGDHQRINDEVVAAAKAAAGCLNDEKAVELAEAVAAEFNSLSNAVSELKKKSDIARHNAQDLLEKMNYQISQQVIDNAPERRANDADIKDMCSILAKEGIVLRSTPWAEMIDSGRIELLIRHYRGESLGDNIRNQVKILWNRTAGQYTPAGL